VAADRERAAIGAVDHLRRWRCRSAAEVFQIRQVCGFGRDLPGRASLPFDDLLRGRYGPEPACRRCSRAVNPAAHVAGDHLGRRRRRSLVPGFRAAIFELLAAGAAGLRWKSRVETPMRSFCHRSPCPRSQGSRASPVVPWLLVGRHASRCINPFDDHAFLQQCRAEAMRRRGGGRPRWRLAARRGPAPRAGARRRQDRHRGVARARAPRRQAEAGANPVIGLADVLVFGEDRPVRGPPWAAAAGRRRSGSARFHGARAAAPRRAACRRDRPHPPPAPSRCAARWYRSSACPIEIDVTAKARLRG